MRINRDMRGEPEINLSVNCGEIEVGISNGKGRGDFADHPGTISGVVRIGVSEVGTLTPGMNSDPVLIEIESNIRDKLI